MLSPAEIRALPVLREVEILVAGGGTAGAVAGIAAARRGRRTLVVEQQGWLGGTQTGALVTPMMPNQLERAPLNGGIDLELNRSMNAAGTSGVWPDGNRGWFDPEALKLALEEMSGRAGTELLYYTQIEDAVVEQGAILGLVVLNKAGRSVIRADRTIDCTGDADAAWRSGAPCEGGDEETGRNQPFSVRFHLGNVDLGRFAGFLASLGRHEVVRDAEGSSVPLLHTAMVWGRGWTLEPLFRRAVAEGVLEERDGNYFQAFTMAGRPGELAFNCPRISTETDGSDPFHLTQAQIEARQAVRRYARFCRRYLPGCEHSYVILTAPMVGVRESRRILGEYRLTTVDYLAGRKFPDAVCRTNYPLDIHRDDDRPRAGPVRPPEGDYAEVPYRSLVPLGVDNLLVAGRCLSASFEAQSAVRIQSNCRAMGEAAAVACDLSLARRVPPRRVDGAALRSELIRQGAFL